MDSIRTHHGIWTEDDYFALGEDEGQRTQLVDGTLVLDPRGEVRHQNILGRIVRELDRVLPDTVQAVYSVNLRLRPGRIVIPDAVVTSDFGDWLVVDAAEVSLVAEVVSAASQLFDRLLKPAMYAEAGIRWYLRIEQDPALELILDRLADGSYVEHARAGTGQRLELPGSGCAIEVDALLRRRG